MQIFIRTNSGQNLALDVEPTDTIQNLESKIQDRTAIAPDLQTLVFNGAKLDVSQTLADYNIQKESTVNEYTYPDMGGFSSTSSGYAGSAGTGQASTACFLKGTRIGTPGGDIPIEELRAGDWVFSIPYARWQRGRRHPALARVAWVGRMHVPAGQLANGLAANRPVRFRRGAFDGVTPHWDLLVTGNHQVAAAGTLVPAGNLVDGEAVAWQETSAATDLYHLELDAFGLVIANGVPCESFLDVGNRAVFDNAGEALAAP